LTWESASAADAELQILNNKATPQAVNKNPFNFFIICPFLFLPFVFFQKKSRESFPCFWGMSLRGFY
jgi:hypothetical protein